MMDRWLRLAFIGLIGVMASACVGLGGEPAIISTRQPAPPATATPPPAPDRGVPASAPDLTNGARLYALNCADCHGDGGRGNGPVALNSGMAIGDFTDPTSARSQTPHQWFTTITEGRIENLMPPWGNVLTEQERWDVAMYTYTLHYTAQQLELGATLYQECAECHGETGRGDGPEAAASPVRVKDLTDQTAMTTIGDDFIYRLLVEGFEDVMPAYGDRFSEDELWAVVAYTRSLSLADPRAAQTPVDDTVLDISGTVTLYGEDAPPDGVGVTVSAFDTETGQPVNLNLTPVQPGPDGMYRFTGVPREDGLAYFASVTYGGYPFASAPRIPQEGTAALTLDIPVYEVTNVPTTVVASAWVNQITAYEGGLEVASVWRVQNQSDTLMYSSGEFLSDGRPIAFRLPIPDGAALLAPESPSALVADDGRSLIDTQPLPPRGQKLMSVRYILPYTPGAPIALPPGLTIGGTVRVLLSPLEMRLTGDLIPALGEEAVGGEFYKTYGGQLALAASQPLTFTLDGQPLAGAPENAAAVVNPSNPAIASDTAQPPAAVTGDVLAPVLAAFGLVVGGFAAFLMLRRPQRR